MKLYFWQLPKSYWRKQDKKWETESIHSCNSWLNCCLLDLCWSCRSESLRILCPRLVSEWCPSFGTFCSFRPLLCLSLCTLFLLSFGILVCCLFPSRSFRGCSSQSFLEFLGLLAFLVFCFLHLLLLLLILIFHFFIHLLVLEHSNFHY